ncbi:MAG: hypothetical protein ACUVX8_16110, partial [Candidatus Zipacnadales bacterium]
MDPKRSPRVGLLTLTLELYDHARPELRPDREQFARQIVALLGEFAEVTYSGISNTREAVQRACRKFVEQDVDLVVVSCLTYAPSLIALPSLRDLSIPILLLNTQELLGVSDDFSFDDLLRNHGVHGLHDLANVMRRSEEPFQVVTGHFADPALRQQLQDWCRAAYAVRQLRELKVGLIGHPFPGMGDFGVDETALLAHVGPQVERVDPRDLAALQASAPLEEVAVLMNADRERFELAEDVTPAHHEASSRAEWALRQVVRDRKLGALAIHYPP